MAINPKNKMTRFCNQFIEIPNIGEIMTVIAHVAPSHSRKVIAVSLQTSLTIVGRFDFFKVDFISVPKLVNEYIFVC